MNCNTVSIVYLMTCVCSSFYVGKAKRQFWRHIKDHVDDLTLGIVAKQSLIARHFATKHQYRPDSWKFMALEHMHPAPGGVTLIIGSYKLIPGGSIPFRLLD